MREVSRRGVLASAGAVLTTVACGIAGGRLVHAGRVQEVHGLKPGEFTWHPERAPDGPVAIIVSLPDQLVHVYRNGVRIAVSTCSTGKQGHATPTGVFTILEKDRHHHSSTYNNAPMPNMNRLTWSGVALHAGNLPGYPASHGCIRLPMKFSERLFGITHVGTPVIVAGSHSQPREVVHPGMVLADYAAHEFESAVVPAMKGKAKPWAANVDSFKGATSLVVSRADMTATLLENGEIVAQGRAVIRDADQPLGSHVFVLMDAHDGHKGLVWHGLAHHHEEGVDVPDAETALIRRVSAEAAVINEMKARMHPGMVLVTTDLPAHPDARTGKDFVVMATEMS
ncbi:MAG: L,D-transpeptidase [Hyphomicrobiaceae bacterium]